MAALYQPDFVDTMPIDHPTDPHAKADERFLASSDRLTINVHVWLAAVALCVTALALYFGLGWVDLIGWLANAGDTLMRASAPAAIVWATQATDTGPAVALRFSHPGGGEHIRHANVLSTYPDGRLRVRLADTGVRCTVHRASVVGCTQSEA